MLGLQEMRNTIIVTSIAFIAVVVASVFYFSSLNKGDQTKRKPFLHIPEDAVMMATFKNDEAVDGVFSDFELFRAILGDDHSRRLRDLQYTLLRDEQLAPYTLGQEILISFHLGEDQLNYLMAVPLTESLPVQVLFDAVRRIDRRYEPRWLDSLSQQSFMLRLPDSTALFVAESGDVLLASFSEALLNDALNQDVPRLAAGAIDYFLRIDNKNAPLTWYINHGQLFGLATGAMHTAPQHTVQLLDGLSGYSALHMNFKSDALMFSGNSTLDRDTAAYLSLYREQRPIEQTLASVFPANTASYLTFGISDFTALHSGITRLLTDRGELNQMLEQHRLIQRASALSVQDELLPEWGDEFAVIELANQAELAIIKVSDSLSFANTIRRISTAYPEGLYRLNHSNLLYYSFGDPLKTFARPYFQLVGQYFVCANQPVTLRQFAADYAARKTLATTLDYIDFESLLANQSNVTWFVNNQLAANTIARRLNPPFAAAYRDTTNFGYHRFYGWSFQLSGAAGNLFTSFYAKYARKAASAAAQEWAFDLNGNLITNPEVFHYNDTSEFILAQDAGHILHAINSNGQKLWNAQLPGPILGKIRQLTDSTIVLTTAKRLYRIDTDGNPLPGFSLVLPRDATHGATVYEDDQQVRIFIPAKNRILAYDGRGSRLGGWDNKTVTGDILFDIKTAHVNDIHYIIAATDAGRVYFFNGNGQPISVEDGGRGAISRNPIGLYLPADDPDRSWVATTDTSGTVHTFTFGRQHAEQHIGPRTSTHTVDFVNISDNPIPDWVFTDHGQLSVYQDTSLVYHYEFGQRLAARPLFFRLAHGAHQIGIATEGNRLIYVFNPDGTIVDGFPLEGHSHFYFGPLRKDGRRYLLYSTGDRKLYAARFD